MIPTAFVAGFFAGFFGIGGGLITVPILFYIFGTLGLDELYLMHLAIGSSFSQYFKWFRLISEILIN